MNDTRFYMKEVSKSLATGITTYQIRDVETNELVAETKSLRTYVAVLMRKSWQNRWYVQYRFGREGLIGKGNSKLSINHPDAYLARLRP